MAEQVTLERLAQSYFSNCWKKSVSEHGQFRRLQDVDKCTCSLRRMLPELIRMIAENPEQPAQQFEDTIRNLVAEQDFIDDSGDTVVDARHDAVVELYVSVFVDVLEKVRQHAITQGQWSDTPVTPQMFG